MKINNPQLIFLLSLLLVLTVGYLILAQHYDPYLGSHLTLSEITNDQEYLAFRPFEVSERGELQVQINNVSTKVGLTLLLSELSLLTGIDFLTLALIPIGLILVILPLFLLLREFFLKGNKGSSFFWFAFFAIILEVSFLCSIYDINTHAWGFFYLLMIIFVIYSLAEKREKIKMLFCLLVFMFLLTTIYYSLQFIVFLIFVCYFIFGLLLKRNLNNKESPWFFFLLAFLMIIFSFIDDFFINFVKDMFLDTNNFLNFISNFFSNLLNTINIFDGSYASVAEGFSLTGSSSLPIYLGFLYYIILIIFVGVFIYHMYNKFKQKGKFSNIELLFLILTFVSIVHFLIYLYLNQFVAYLILLFYPIIAFYVIQKYLPRKTIFVVLILSIILLKLIFNFYLVPNYEKYYYQDYDSLVSWAEDELLILENQFVLSDLYFAQKMILADPLISVKGFYFFNEEINNLAYLYSGDAEEILEGLEQENISYLVITKINEELKVPLMYGISILFEPIDTQGFPEIEGLNKIYSSELGSIYSTF
jgi:hypothetical protein